MRFLVGLGLVGVLAWCAWWAVGSFGMQQAVTAWLEDRRAEGWQAEVSANNVGGFPADLQITLRDLALADPDTGVAVQLDPLVIAASPLWPGDVTVRLPDTAIQFAAPDAKSALVMANGAMSMQLQPGRALEVQQLSWTSDAWELRDPDVPLLSAASLSAEVLQGDDPATYTVKATAPDLAPGAALRDQMLIPADWPVTFDALALDLTATFDEHWGLSALQDRRPQPRRIDLRLAEAAWADLRIAIAAELTVDETGQPNGTVAFQARNWRTMLDLAERAGVLPPNLRGQVEWGLSSLAEINGNPDSIDVTLTLSGGFVRLGLIPIAPAPLLVLR